MSGQFKKEMSFAKLPTDGVELFHQTDVALTV